MAGMARGYSSELQTTSLYKTNEGDLALPALQEGNLRKSDTLIDAAALLTISVSNHCCAVRDRIDRAAGQHQSKWSIEIICIFTLYCFYKHSPPG
jgi:hypothetical protein